MTEQATGEFALPNRIVDAHNHPEFLGRTLETVLAEMDANHVERQIIMGLMDADSNQHVMDWTRRHGDRFVPGVYLDPRQGRAALEDTDRYFQQGVRIVKLFPNLGYFPDDEQFLPFFEAVAARGMMILTHCGWLMPMPGTVVASYYSHPGRFEKLLRRFPQMPIVFAHMGGLAGWMEAVMLTTRTPNAYVDVSPGQGLQVLQKGWPFVTLIPPQKLLYGADGAIDTEPFRKALVDLGYGPHLEAIFYGNAKALLTQVGAWA